MVRIVAVTETETLTLFLEKIELACKKEKKISNVKENGGLPD